MSVGEVTISDYQDMHGRTISNNRGPICIGCGEPFKVGNHDNCYADNGNLGAIGQVESPSARQAAALELIAFNLGKIVKHLEAKEQLGELPPPVFAVKEGEGVGAMFPEHRPFLNPTTMTDEQRAEQHAKGEAKKAEALAKLKGGRP